MSLRSLTTTPSRTASSHAVPPPALSQLPERLRLAPGRTTVWRSPTCLQLGLDPQQAMVLDDLPEPLAALLKRMDGVHSTAELVAEAELGGSTPGEALSMLTDLHRCGLVQDAGATDHGPAGWHRVALASEATSWSVHTTGPTRDVLRQRRKAAVRVIGSGRVGVALATLLATAGIGQVTLDATGTVVPSDVGSGYRPDDLGRPRAAAAADAVRRCAPGVSVAPRRRPSLIVLCDVVVPEPVMVTELLDTGIPHLISYAHEGTAVVGPLVWPGRSSCLHCAQLHRADLDPAWPRLAAQLAGQVPSAGLASVQLAAALTVEQVLAVLAGPGAGRQVPPIWGAALELDPVRGTLRRHPRPAHPRCDCGAR